MSRIDRYARIPAVIESLIDNPGYAILHGGLIIEWGHSTVLGGAGEAVIAYQKLTKGHYPMSLVCIVSRSVGADEMYTVHIDRLEITGPNVTHVVSVRKLIASNVDPAPNGTIIQWIAIGN